MCVENGLGNTAGLEQREAEQVGISDGRPDRAGHVAADRNIFDLCG